MQARHYLNFPLAFLDGAGFEFAGGATINGTSLQMTDGRVAQIRKIITDAGAHLSLLRRGKDGRTLRTNNSRRLLLAHTPKLMSIPTQTPKTHKSLIAKEIKTRPSL